MDKHAFAMSVGEAAALSDARVVALEAALASERAARALDAAKIAALTEERDRLRASHERLRLELEMLKRRIFVAKAERVDTAQLEMESVSYTHLTLPTN